MKSLSSWIIYNGSLTSDKFSDHAVMIQEAAEKNGIHTTIVKNYEIIMSIENGDVIYRHLHSLELPDFVVFLDKDILLARQLEMLGLKVYNSAESIGNCDNKALMYQKLANNGIPIPETIIAPKVYKGFELKDKAYYQYVIKQLGFPMVIKEVHGSFGMKVYLIHNKEEFYQKIHSLSGISFVFQKFIQSSYGRDIRINIVGDKAVASMYRQSDKDFRANVSNGGKMYTYEPTKEQIDLAIHCSKIMGTYFSGIDILFGEDDKPIICEVNSNAHIRNIFNCTGVNVAEHMIDYILSDLEDLK